MEYTYDRSAAERRVNAYLDFLMAAYGTDARGLALLAGIHPQTMTKFIKAPNGKRSTAVMIELAGMTGVSLGWLFAEEPVTEAMTQCC